MAPKRAGEGGIVIELSCDGVTGIGYATEAPYTGELLAGMRQALEQIAKPILEGSDPRAIAVLAPLSAFS